METYWVPGVNNLKTFGRWAFAEFIDVFKMQSGFEELIEEKFKDIISEHFKGDGVTDNREPPD